MRRPVARRPVARRLAAVCLVGGLAAGLVIAGSTTPLLFLGPWLLVLAPLVAGRYVGERSLLRLVRHVRRRPAPRRSQASRSPRRPAIRRLPRGGRLLACSLAVRPPPVRA
ncbi:MAG TPA: hypothetical protein VHW26_13005 [Solirubrobacteraceae bacterium]|nr:hypothetical protein [Solirubrobacteraceae bacterium]